MSCGTETRHTNKNAGDLDKAYAYPGHLRFFVANSFTAETSVHTDEGQKPIKEIEVGDKVLSEDPETGEQGYFEVVAITSHAVDEVLHITLDVEDEDSDNDEQQLNTDTMEVTPEHPVYVEGKGWLWAENLSIGDRLRRADGGMAKVLAIERVALDEPEVVYNFTVKGPHTYFVLETGVLVHNASPGNCLDYGSLSDDELVARVQNERDADAVFEAVFNRGWYVNDERFGLPPSEIEDIVLPKSFQLPNGESIPTSGPGLLAYAQKNVDQLRDYDEALEAFIEPISGIPVGVRNASGELEFLPTHILQPDGRWSQGEVGPMVYSKLARDRVPLEDVVEKLERLPDNIDKIPREQVELLVFQKTAAMDEWGQTTRFKKDAETIYSGNYANLAPGNPHSINNRSFTVVTMAQLNNIRISVRWATANQIRFYAYQYTALEYGTEVILRGRNQVLRLDGSRRTIR